MGRIWWNTRSWPDSWVRPPAFTLPAVAVDIGTVFSKVVFLLTGMELAPTRRRAVERPIL